MADEPDYGEFDDGREDDNDLPEIILPAPASDGAALFQSLRSAQLQNQELRKRLANARLLISSLKADLGGKRGRKREAPVDPALAAERERVMLLAKKWAIFQDPWINGNAFMHLPPADAPSLLSAARFKTEETYKEGIIVELHEYLRDPNLQRLATSLPAFLHEFQLQVQAQRNNATNRIRSNVCFILRELSLDSTIVEVATAGVDRGASLVLKSLLLNNNNPDSVYAPIFFPDLDVRRFDWVFLNEYQPRMIRAICFGINSIQTAIKDFKYSAGLIGMKWNVKSVNASAIAWSAIMLRFILSADTTFSEVGTASGINYRESFYTYRKFIVEEEADGTKYSKDLFLFYNQRVFPGLSGAADPAELQAVDEVAEMRARIRAMAISGSLVPSHITPVDEQPCPFTFTAEPSTVISNSSTAPAIPVVADNVIVPDMPAPAEDSESIGTSNQRGRRGKQKSNFSAGENLPAKATRASNRITRSTGAGKTK
ncbi:hypothetical protein VKT23_010222 [Stygiomarasmius scandens]|uniref:Uncharacterized protein n=1 Tax=Marasmiellus scandens TaxID=2682957 RepID=A0ABR1JCE4_9AGAR